MTALKDQPDQLFFRSTKSYFSPVVAHNMKTQGVGVAEHGLGVSVLKIKREMLLRFSRTPLKHPMSKFLLQFLLEEEELMERITFVHNREFLSNTMLISELGSPRVGFELELGARQREEVSIVNGQLIRQTRKDRSLCTNEPMEAIKPLREFKGRLYVVFSFAGPTPAWYDTIVEPNPHLPVEADDKESIEAVIDEIVQEQIDLVILAVSLKHQIDQALKERDRQTFDKIASVYREVVQRCLWDI